MNISIIVAVSENGVIGKDNQLLWHLSGDMKRFKALTTGHTIIMGKNTFLSIGKALPNRRNIVLSSSLKKENYDNIEIYSSIEELTNSIQSETEEVFIIGGGEIYRQFLPIASKIYLTYVHTTIEGDTTFPSLNDDEWKAIAKEEMKADEKNDFDYDFIDYYRV